MGVFFFESTLWPCAAATCKCAPRIAHWRCLIPHFLIFCLPFGLLTGFVLRKKNVILIFYLLSSLLRSFHRLAPYYFYNQSDMKQKGPKHFSAHLYVRAVSLPTSHQTGIKSPHPARHNKTPLTKPPIHPPALRCRRTVAPVFSPRAPVTSRAHCVSCTRRSTSRRS